MYILHTTLVGMYIVGVRFGQKPQRVFRPEALCGQASCEGGMGTEQNTERAPE